MKKRIFCLLLSSFLLTGCDIFMPKGWRDFSSDSEDEDTESTNSGDHSDSDESVPSPSSSEEPLPDFEYELYTESSVQYARITKVNIDPSVKEMTIPNTLDGYPVGTGTANVLSAYTSLESLNTGLIGASDSYGSYSYKLFGDNNEAVPASLKELTITAKNISGSTIWNLPHIESITLSGVEKVSSIYNMPALKRIDLGNLEAAEGNFLATTPLLETITEDSENFYVTSDGDLYSADMSTFYYGIFNGSRTSWTANEALTKVMTGAFQKCFALQTVTFNAGCTTIPNQVLKDATSLVSLTIPNAASLRISAYFSSLPTTLTSVTILGGYKICTSFFDGITTISSLSIPETITMVDSYAFRNCTSLSTLTFVNLHTIGKGAFQNCTATVYNLGSGGKSFGEEAFMGSSVQSIDIPSNTTTIPNYLFKNCTSLSSVTIPSTVTSIGDGAFMGCTNLTSIILPAGLKTIGVSAFEGCSSLASVNFQNASVELGNRCFYGCGLTSISNTTNIKKIGVSCFACSSCPITSINMPNLTLLGWEAFQGWSHVQSMTVGLIPSYLGAVFSETSFANTYKVDIDYSISGFSNKYTFYIPNSLTSLTIVNQKVIDYYTCAFTTSLVTLNLPDNVDTVRAGAFRDCTNIDHVVFPLSLLVVESNAFMRLNNCRYFDFHYDSSNAANHTKRRADLKSQAFSSKRLEWFVGPCPSSYAKIAQGSLVIPGDCSTEPTVYLPYSIQGPNCSTNWITAARSYKTNNSYSDGNQSGTWHYVGGIAQTC